MKQSRINHGFTKINWIISGVCQRCHSLEDRHVLNEYGKMICLDCQILFHEHQSDYLYVYERVIPLKEHPLAFPFKLTKTQQKTSALLCQKFINKEDVFVQAVCGSGKTEMTYQVIQLALNQGKKVCFAIPRREIVLELTTRFQKVFPNTIIKPLCEGYHDDESAHLIISTIHQLIHYDSEFDLILLDEVDAYPFEGNIPLKRLVQKAMKDDGCIISLSATVSKEMAKINKKNQLFTHLVYERYHKVDLDIPKVLFYPDLLSMIEQGKYPKELDSIFKRWIDSNARAFLFVPSIRLGHMLKDILSKDYPVDFIYASCPDKKKILANFQTFKTPFLLTTTLFERGVTYDNIQVMVFHTSHPVYSNQTLIQIAGRVGRYPFHPSGEILFITCEMTSEIKKAIRYVKQMNQRKNKS